MFAPDAPQRGYTCTARQHQDSPRSVCQQSGNPGRASSESKRSAGEALATDGEAVLTVVLDAAKAGDLAACKLVLDRVCPALKPTAAPVYIRCHLRLAALLAPPAHSSTPQLVVIYLLTLPRKWSRQWRAWHAL